MNVMFFLKVWSLFGTKAKFNQQTLTAVKLCHVQNFSPHKTITVYRTNEIYPGKINCCLQHWIDKMIIYIAESLNDKAQKSFLRDKTFPATDKEFEMVINVVPNGILQLMKCHFRGKSYNN